MNRKNLRVTFLRFTWAIFLEAYVSMSLIKTLWGKFLNLSILLPEYCATVGATPSFTSLVKPSAPTFAGTRIRTVVVNSLKRQSAFQGAFLLIDQFTERCLMPKEQLLLVNFHELNKYDRILSNYSLSLKFIGKGPDSVLKEHVTLNKDSCACIG